jgi:hypothetical protein
MQGAVLRALPAACPRARAPRIWRWAPAGRWVGRSVGRTGGRLVGERVLAEPPQRTGSITHLWCLIGLECRQRLKSLDSAYTEVLGSLRNAFARIEELFSRSQEGKTSEMVDKRCHGNSER